MKRYKIRKSKLGHAGQIKTTRRTIIELMRELSGPIAINTVYLIAEFLNGHHDDLRLYGVCTHLYYLSRMVYSGKNGACKLSAEEYQRILFEPDTETVEEVYDALVYADKRYSPDDFEKNKAFCEEIFLCLYRVSELWCRELACINERVFISELAYAFEYIVERRGRLPSPKFRNNTSSLFPTNYTDYNYTAGIEKLEVFNGLF